MRRFVEIFIAVAATTYLMGLLITFLADVHDVALPERISTLLILLSSAGLAVTVSFGTALLAGSGHRNHFVTGGWCFVLLLLSFLLWPYFRTGIEGTTFEAALLRLHPVAPDVFSWIGVFITELMLALVFFNKGSASGGGHGFLTEEDWTDLLNSVSKLSLEIEQLKKSGATPEQPPKAPGANSGDPPKEPPKERAPKRPPKTAAPKPSLKLVPKPTTKKRTNRERVLAALDELGEADAPLLSEQTGLTPAQVNNALKNNGLVERESIVQPSKWRGRTLYRLKKRNEVQDA